MATLKLDLSNLSYDNNHKFCIIYANKTNLKYAGYKVEAVTNGNTVTFADGSTLEIDNNDKVTFKAASGTGTFDVGVLASGDYEAAKTAIVDQVEAVTKDASEAVGATATSVADALNKEADKYNKNTWNYVVFNAAAKAAVGDTPTAAKNAADGAANTTVNGFKAADITKITTLDFTNAGAVTCNTSKLTGLTALTGSAYADKLTVTTTVDAAVNAGEGNDVVDIAGIADGKTASVNLGDGDDTLNITKDVATGTVAVTLGDGKDVINVASSAVTVTADKYNYADGDKINLTYSGSDSVFGSGGNAALATVGSNTKIGSLTVGNITATVDASDNVAAANVSGEKQTVTFFTATDNSKEVEINAKGIANETRIDAAKSKLANITLGSGESKVTLADVSATGKDVINATGASKATITTFDGANDTLILDGANLTNIKLANATVNGASTGAELTYGKTTVDFAGNWNGAAKVINLNDSKLAFDLVGTGTTLSDADMYYGHENKNTVVKTTDNVHLTEVDKYKNIYKVSVAGTGVEADKLDLSGFTTSGTDGIEINATNANAAVNVWAYNKNAKATDKVTLSAADTYQDTVSFVSDDGKVSVTGFDFGSGEKNDILYLRDTKDLQKLAVKSGEIKLGNSKATIGHDGATTDLMQVKLADGTTSLVAGNFSTVAANANKVVVDLTSTQAVDFYALTGTKNTLTVTKNISPDDAVNFKYSNFDANHTTGTLVKSINVSGFGNEDDEVTIGAVANVVATDVTSGKTHIWVCGAADSGTVNLTGNGSKDQIDFVSGTDKKVTVTGYDAAGEDTIYLRGAKDLKAVTAGYKFDEKNGGIQITGVDNAASKLVLDSVTGDLNLKTLDGSSLKAIVSKADATFSTDTQIYAGMAKIVADMSTEGDVAVRIGTKGEIGLDSSATYYIGNSVKEFDGSNSNAVFHLAGSSTAATTLKGGNTENSFYGGGSFNDKMVGNSSAVDTFYFGKNDGKDTIEEADSKDTVCLLNVSKEEINDIIVDTKKNVISIGASDTLTFGQGAEDALTAGELTFNIGGNNYVCKDGKFVAKEA